MDDTLPRGKLDPTSQVPIPGEKFLIRCTGGPADGQTRVAPEGMTWPLPEELEAGPQYDGRYVKFSESQLPPMPPGSHVMRGAEFIWVEKNGPAPS